MYENIVSYGAVHGAKIPSFEEFSSVTSGDDVSSFDDDADKKLEAHALKKLQEAQAKHGK